MDIDIPEMKGIEIGSKIKDENGSCEIVRYSQSGIYCESSSLFAACIARIAITLLN